MKTIKTLFKNLKRYSFLLQELVKKGIKLKYRRSYLGILWTLLEPLLTMLVLVFIFGELLGKGDETFPVYVLTGRLIYSYYASSTKACVSSIRRNAGMIKKVYVPKYLYPVSTVIYNYITFLISLVVLIAVSLVIGVYPTLYVFQVVVPLVILFILALGSGLILAALGVFFRDIEYIWDVATMLIMYASAIFYYPDELLSGNKGIVLQINPVFCIIDNFRSGVFGEAMDLSMMFYSLAFSLALLLIGAVVFRRKQDEFILHI